MLAQALGDFMLLSALKKGQINGNSSDVEPVLPRESMGRLCLGVCLRHSSEHRQVGFLELSVFNVTKPLTT